MSTHFRIFIGLLFRRILEHMVTYGLETDNYIEILLVKITQTIIYGYTIMYCYQKTSVIKLLLAYNTNSLCCINVLYSM